MTVEDQNGSSVSPLDVRVEQIKNGIWTEITQFNPKLATEDTPTEQAGVNVKKETKKVEIIPDSTHSFRKNVLSKKYDVLAGIIRSNLPRVHSGVFINDKTLKFKSIMSNQNVGRSTVIKNDLTSNINESLNLNYNSIQKTGTLNPIKLKPFSYFSDSGKSAYFKTTEKQTGKPTIIKIENMSINYKLNYWSSTVGEILPLYNNFVLSSTAPHMVLYYLKAMSFYSELSRYQFETNFKIKKLQEYSKPIKFNFLDQEQLGVYGLAKLARTAKQGKDITFMVNKSDAKTIVMVGTLLKWNSLPWLLTNRSDLNGSSVGQLNWQDANLYEVVNFVCEDPADAKSILDNLEISDYLNESRINRCIEYVKTFLPINTASSQVDGLLAMEPYMVELQLNDYIKPSQCPYVILPSLVGLFNVVETQQFGMFSLSNEAMELHINHIIFKSGVIAVTHNIVTEIIDDIGPAGRSAQIRSKQKN